MYVKFSMCIVIYGWQCIYFKKYYKYYLVIYAIWNNWPAMFIQAYAQSTTPRVK